VLVDSSVWIAYLRGDNLIEVELLTKALELRESIWLAPPILQEVLQGADSPARFDRWDRAGVTPRSANDCLIATHAIFAGVPLLHHDRDFNLIAGVEPKLILVAA
jgi:predicted nucleic acid-binding protein